MLHESELVIACATQGATTCLCICLVASSSFCCYNVAINNISTYSTSGGYVLKRRGGARTIKRKSCASKLSQCERKLIYKCKYFNNFQLLLIFSVL